VFKQIHRRLPPKKVKFYFEVWLCVVLSAMIFSCGGKAANEMNLTADPNAAPEVSSVSESNISRARFEANDAG